MRDPIFSCNPLATTDGCTGVREIHVYVVIMPRPSFEKFRLAQELVLASNEALGGGALTDDLTRAVWWCPLFVVNVLYN